MTQTGDTAIGPMASKEVELSARVLYRATVLPRRAADISSLARSSPHPSAPFQPSLRPSPGPFRTVKTASSAAGGGFDGTGGAGTRSDGRKQGRNGADGCGGTGPQFARYLGR